MKKLLFTAALVCALLLCAGALSDAADITASVRLEAAGNTRLLKRLTDRRFDRAWQGGRGKGALTLRSDIPMHGLYVIWEEQPRAFTLAGGSGSATEYGDSVFLHQYYPLNGENEIRLTPKNDSGKHFGIKELYVLGEGEVPSWVQRWEPAWEDADLMLLFAHPDDEVLFFGGLLPYYAGERGLRVVPVLLTDAGSQRSTELLNCLWSLGQRYYPVFGPFRDVYAWNLKDAYAKFGKNKTTRFLVEQLRRFKPEVLVTHDIGGEYGHGAHRLCADLATRSLTLSADPSFDSESYALYGGHTPQKLYLHLYRKNGLEMDWDQPLLSFGGRTGFELAEDAYGSFHLSQHRYEQYRVEPRNSKYSSYRFGLYFSSVGPDVQKNDLMENTEIAGGQGS